MARGSGHQLSRRSFLLGSAAAVIAAKVAPVAQSVEVITQGDFVIHLPNVNYPIGTVLDFVFNTGTYPQVFVEAWGGQRLNLPTYKSGAGGGGNYVNAIMRRDEDGKWIVISKEEDK